MTTGWIRRSGLRALALGLVTGSLAACTGLAFGPPALAPGTPIAEAIRTLGPPTAQHRIADGATRLEYWGGNYARSTWMIDFDAAGRLVAANQVLTEANFYALPAGISSEELRVRMGPPMSTFAIPRQGIQVWNYRYQTNDCLWFQVSIRNADGRVAETTRGIDPACDAPNDARS
ncbi:MAG: hypothetical protein ABIX46_02400 [Burkholderiaceae bacterium]